MNIIQRNFFRLIRIGAFEQKEQVEPMSVYKWGQLYQLAVMHDVAGFVYEGLQRSKDQFFLHLTDKQWKQWEKTIQEIRKKARNAEEEPDEFLRADHLTNPLLNKKLQTILDDEQSDTRTRQVLLTIIRVSRHILNEGVPLRQLVELGICLRSEGHHADFTTLGKWLKTLQLQQVAKLEASLLIELLGFEKEEIVFAGGKRDKNVEQVAQELIEFTNTRARDFYFSQDAGNIFVHTSNGSAMLGHIHRSARYFRYFPSETLTNFFASFAHSLSHIEE
ncbi:MAG: hypothetical protein J6W38_10655 [Prevotella sp.]|nr:hypothetical protein [Prevotella sp.]MBO7130209.1 hypothetical protein [Prevotella sp.]